ncbi:MAG TPA: hypothetical protein VF043_35070 [Ktedonobacteraceae bacterium]
MQREIDIVVNPEMVQYLKVRRIPFFLTAHNVLRCYSAQEG